MTHHRKREPCARIAAAARPPEPEENDGRPDD